MREQKLEFKYSKHGPVTGEKEDKAYAIRIAGLNNTGIIEQYHKMAMANNLQEFESALRHASESNVQCRLCRQGR